MPNFRALRSLFSKKTTHSQLVARKYNFIISQTCDVAFSAFLKSRDSVTAVRLSCQQVLLQIF